MLIPAPKVSVLVVAYRMARQLENTLLSLSPGFQQGVSEGDYEVVVMENASGDNLPQAVVDRLPGNFRYVLRQEPSVTPVYAVNEGFALCRAPIVCLMIDGARMVSPGTISTALQAFAISENAVVAVPGYHLGREEQHLSEADIDPAAEERRLMDSIDWKTDGYELFRIATLSGANQNGYLHPLMECNCLFASAENYASIGHANTDFTLPGGGSINLHMYRSLGMLPGSRIFVLPGEGSFHQYHGGVTTSSYEDREAELERHRTQLHSYWPGGFNSLRRQPNLLGKVPPQAHGFLQFSLQRSQQRFERMSRQNKIPWPDEPR